MGDTQSQPLDSVVVLPPRPQKRFAKIEDYFDPVKDGFLGKGQFGSVCLMQRKRDGKIFAVKNTKPTILDKQDGRMQTKEDVKRICQEIKTLRRVQDMKHVLQMNCFFWDGKMLHIVTEVLEETLRQWRIRQDTFEERQARLIARTVLMGIKNLHDANVVHRDIKSDNLMLKRTDDLSSLKIVDFGFARVMDRPTAHFCGSRGHIAPEIYLREPYGCEVDMFSFGVMMFRLLSGKQPFPAGPVDATQEATLQLRYRMDDPEWDAVPDDAKDLVRKCLKYKDERITAAQALAHPWIAHTGASLSILTTDETFVGSQAGTASQAVLELDPTKVSEGGMETARGTRFWTERTLQPLLSQLMTRGGFHGRVVTEEDGNILIEEFDNDMAVILPNFIASLPRYTELECRNIFRQMVLRLKTFHQAGVAHRNLNPSNFVVEENIGRDGFQINIRGIQYAQPTNNGRVLTGRIGHGRSKFQFWSFIAPEVDNAFVHDERVDLWSLGVMLYTLLCGVGPFKGTPDEILWKKSVASFDFDWFKPSSKARNLVEGLIQANPKTRLSLDQVLSHPWMQMPDAALARRELALAQVVHSDYKRRPGYGRK